MGRAEKARHWSIEERRAEVARLLRMGCSERAVADELGIPKSTVHDDAVAIAEELVANRVGNAEQMRALATERIAAAAAECHRVLQTASGSDPELVLKATDRIERLESRLAKMWGIDAPERVENTISSGAELTPEAIASATARVFGELAHAGTGDDARNGRVSADDNRPAPDAGGTPSPQD